MLNFVLIILTVVSGRDPNEDNIIKFKNSKEETLKRGFGYGLVSG